MESHINLPEISRNLKRFPTLPGVALELFQAFQRETLNTKELSHIVSTDPPLILKILKIANSPFYGLRSKIESVEQAIAFIGLNSVKNLALSFSLIKTFSNKKKLGFDYPQFWKDSLIGAVSAKYFNEQFNEVKGENAFLSGLLQNIGSLILAENFPNNYSQMLSVLKSNNLSIIDAETQAFGFQHMAVGQYILDRWGLPEEFSIPIGYHHTPDAVELREPNISSLTKILHLSSHVIEIFRNDFNNDECSTLKSALIKHNLISKINLTQILNHVSNSIKDIFPIFDIKFNTDQYLKFIDSTNEELSKLSENLITQVDIQKSRIEDLLNQVDFDSLTKLNNQKRFYEILQQELDRARRYKSNLSLIMTDIDHFKSINDFYGHLGGDSVLKSVAATLKAGLRESDHIARYGGEEFAIILPSTNFASAINVAERLRIYVRDLKVPYNLKEISVTLSFGLSSLDSNDSKIGVESFIRQADEALYEAKKSGRNRVCSFRPKEINCDLPKILIIDDEDVVLVTVTKMLERLGFSAISASNGEKAIALFQQFNKTIPMVLLDIMMPGIGTLEIIKRIRSINNKAKILLSSGFDASQIKKDVLINSDGFLGKPYSLKELNRVVKNTFYV